jgi:ABC-type nitrate/sulfonate/bicarbonate transport system substrate-binding protein
MQELREQVSNKQGKYVLSRRSVLQGALAGSALALGASLSGCSVLGLNRSRLNLGIAPGSQTLWRYVAQRKDELLGARGYDATFISYPDEATLRSAFIGGKVDVIASLVPTVAALADDGLAVQLFLPIAWLHEGYPFITTADSSIKGLKDFVGKRVATYPLDHPGMAYWRALYLASTKLDLSALNPTTSLSTDQLLLAKQVDVACMGGVQWAALQPNSQFRKVTDLETEWKQLSSDNRLLVFGGYIARREFIQQHAQFVKDFVDVHRQALQDYHSDRVRFLSVTAAYPNPPMSTADNQAQATYLGYDDVTPDRLVLSDQDVSDYQKLFSLMAQAGYLPKALSDIPSLFYRLPS